MSGQDPNPYEPPVAQGAISADTTVQASASVLQRAFVVCLGLVAIILLVGLPDYHSFLSQVSPRGVPTIEGAGILVWLASLGVLWIFAAYGFWTRHPLRWFALLGPGATLLIIMGVMVLLRA